MLYNLFFVIGFAIALFYILFFAKKFAIKKTKGILLIVFCYATIYILMFLLFYLVNGFFGGQNMIRVFVFIPLAVAFFSKAFDIETRKALDYVAPVPVIIFAFSHIGCIFPGCCHSNIEVPWGIYNPVTETTLFPNQILESILAIFTAFLLIYLLHKKSYDMGGKAMGYMLILYGSQRFLLEFIRDNEKLFWGISELALWSLAAILSGVVLNFIVLRKKVVVDTQQTISNDIFISEKEDVK